MFACESQECWAGTAAYTVPEGKRAVIELIILRRVGLSTPKFFVLNTAGGVTAYHTLPATDNVLTMSLRLYGDPGTTIYVSPGDGLSGTISGYLLPAETAQ